MVGQTASGSGWEGSMYNYLTGYSDEHPKTGAKCSITAGLSCFMQEFCSEPNRADTNFGSYIADTYGREVKSFLANFNYGFLYDFQGAQACGWAEWTQVINFFFFILIVYSSSSSSSSLLHSLNFYRENGTQTQSTDILSVECQNTF